MSAQSNLTTVVIDPAGPAMPPQLELPATVRIEAVPWGWERNQEVGYVLSALFVVILVSLIGFLATQPLASGATLDGATIGVFGLGIAGLFAWMNLTEAARPSELTLDATGLRWRRRNGRESSLDCRSPRAPLRVVDYFGQTVNQPFWVHSHRWSLQLPGTQLFPIPEAFASMLLQASKEGRQLVESRVTKQGAQFTVTEYRIRSPQG